MKVYQRIQRLVLRLSRNRILSEASVRSIAHRAAMKLQPNVGAAFLAIRHAGFEYPPEPNYGYYRGMWVGNALYASSNYASAEQEARSEGRQFIADYRSVRRKLLGKQYAQASEFALQTRRYLRQLTKEKTHDRQGSNHSR